MNRLLAFLALLLGSASAACATRPTSAAPSRAPDVVTFVVETARPLVLTTPVGRPAPTDAPTPTPARSPTPFPTPLNILDTRYLRSYKFQGSEIKIEKTLEPGINYSRYIATYHSELYKIFGLLTVPMGKRPLGGWPAIVLNHGYIPPYEYKTTERYVAYVDALARSGYVVFKIDYRGHGESEGSPTGPYATPAYTIDALNALASLEKYQEVDAKRIGMWGHSMGGQVTLRAMVTSAEIKAGVIWGGVVGSYPNLINHWRHPTNAAGGSALYPAMAAGWRSSFLATYGTPEEHPEFWASISPNTFVGDISGPVQLHAGGADEEVPIEFSEELYAELQAAGKTAEFYIYPGSDHNISQAFPLAMQRTITFFDKYLRR